MVTTAVGNSRRDFKEQSEWQTGFQRKCPMILVSRIKVLDVGPEAEGVW